MKLNKVICMLICIVMVLGTVPATFAATTVIYDDFEDCEPCEGVTVTSANQQLQISNSNWYFVSQQTGNPLGGNANGLIVDVDGNKMLKLGGTNERYNYYPERRQYFEYRGDYSSLENTYKIEYNIPKKEVTRAGVGLKFMIHNDNKNYYQLHFMSDDNEDKKVLWAFSKFVDNRIVKTVYSTITYTSPASGAGVIKTGKVSLVYNNGAINWVIKGVRFNGSSFTDEGTFVDDNPFEADAKNCKIGFATTYPASYNSYVYVDDFKVSNMEVFKDFEPTDIVYKNLSQNSSVNEFDKAYPIRRICCDSLAGQTIPVEFSEGSATNTINAKFNEKGIWVNLEDIAEYSKVQLPTGKNYSDLKILTEIDSEDVFTLKIKTPKTVIFPIFASVFDNTQFTWTSADEKIATVENGEITGRKSGSTTITVECGSTSYNIPIVIRGEMDDYLDNFDDYIALKQPVINAINSAISNKNIENMCDILNGLAEQSITKILDIDSDYLISSSSNTITETAKKLITHDQFTIDDPIDVYYLENEILREYTTCKFDNLTSVDKVIDLLETKNDVLGFRTDVKYYANNKSAVAENLICKTFNNYKELKKEFENAYVIYTLKNVLSYSAIGELVNDCKEEIGYNESHFNKVASTALYKYILNNKNNISNIDELKNLIDSYTKSSEAGSTGGGGGGASSKTIARNNVDYIVDNSTAATNETNAKEAIKKTEPIYNDITDDMWYADYIYKLAAKNIMNGNDGYIRPEDTITRAEFLKILLKSANVPVASEEYQCSYKDVSENDWFAAFVKDATACGIVQGSGNEFKPNDSITREEIAAMVYRTIIVKGVSFDLSSAKLFKDESKISDWAYSAVLNCCSYGLINGYEDETFKPQNNATRAECAKIVCVFAEKLN